MKVKRCKHAKKTISFYKNNFGFREPYQILVDGTFCQAALQGKINISEQLPKYLGSKLQILTTRCILLELSSQPALKGAHFIAKRLQLRKCSHSGVLPPTECINTLIGSSNVKHYCVATQDSELQRVLKTKGSVPLLHIIRNTVVIEGPSNTAFQKVQEITEIKLKPSDHEQSLVEHRIPKDQPAIKHKRKRPQGPNPLSVKKRTRFSVPDKLTKKGMATKSKGRRLRLQRRKAIEQLIDKIQQKS